MPRNIEIKARVPRPSALLDAVIDIADRGPTVFAQDDTFFACPEGRLKLRTFSEHEGQLIFYRRDDLEGPKLSEYVMATTTEPDALRGTLALAYGIVGRVKKTRTLFLVGTTRVHLDDVEDLGHYMELEVVLEADQTPGGRRSHRARVDGEARHRARTTRAPRLCRPARRAGETHITIRMRRSIKHDTPDRP